MEIFFIIAGFLVIVIGYFFFGAIVKLLWGFLPVLFLVPISFWIMFQGGYLFAIIGLILLIGNIFWTDTWQGTILFSRVERRINKIFFMD